MRFLKIHAIALYLACSGSATATSLDVQIAGAIAPAGSIRCAVFVSPEGFPDDASQARLSVLSAQTQPLVCRFEDLPAGRIAIAVSHDANANGKLDTNFLGIPKEAWGVSRGMRPSFRAPRFDEAAIDYDGWPLTLTIEVVQ